MAIRTRLILPDLHFPYEDQKYIDIVTQLMVDVEPYGVVQLGDAVDCWQISSYDKDPERRTTLKEDILRYKARLDIWEEVLPAGAFFDQLEGNHEDRLRRYLWKNARELHDMVPDVPTVLQLDWRNKRRKVKFRWHSYQKWDSLRIADCVLHHGFYFSKHVAMVALTKYPCNFIFGHTHRFQHVTDGRHYACTLGHGSDPDKTMHTPTPSEWKQSVGFLHEIIKKSGTKTTLEAYNIDNGSMVFRGKEVTSGRRRK